MTLEDLKYFASSVCPKIEGMDTNMRGAITAKGWLALTLRILATGIHILVFNIYSKFRKVQYQESEVCVAIIN